MGWVTTKYYMVQFYEAVKQKIYKQILLNKNNSSGSKDWKLVIKDWDSYQKNLHIVIIIFEIECVYRTSDDKKDTKIGKKKRIVRIREEKDQDEEGEWEEVTSKGGAPLIVVSNGWLTFSKVLYF